MKAVKIIIPMLILIIAIVVIVRSSGPPPRPDEVDQRMLSAIDIDSLEIFEMSVEDMANAEVDPATGYRTDQSGRQFAAARRCDSCDEFIPPAPAGVDVLPEEIEELQADYECPKCGGLAYQ